MNSVGDPATQVLDVVRSLAEKAAHQRGATLLGCGLRLFEGIESLDCDAAEETISPFALGRTYELLLAPTTRKRTGSHLTPEAVARSLVAMLPPARPEDRVLDPSVGGAAFLLAAADQLIEAGARPAHVIEQLFGVDIDPGAVVVAEAAIAVWALDHGISPGPHPQIVVGDGLMDSLPPAERVVGNPPFLNQLRTKSAHSRSRRSQLRERWGDLVLAYTDDAWLFLAAGLEAMTATGCMAMVQPVSVLAAKHGMGVRQLVHETTHMTGMWIARDKVFDAAVQVCGIVVQAAQQQPTPAVARYAGADFSPIASYPTQPQADEWGSIASEVFGIPQIMLRPTAGTLGEIATATAGFRDQFYGFVPWVSEDHEPSSDHPKLVTVGMIDVMRLQWGERVFKFAGGSYQRPVIDRHALEGGDPSLGEWVARRSRPKVLLATQTRVVEAWVDAEGFALPATPVISVEPHDVDDEQALWRTAALLSAPATSANWMRMKFGSALSNNSLRFAASDVPLVPQPPDEAAWDEGAEILQSAPEDLTAFANAMGAAFGLNDADLARWWLARVGRANALG